MELMIIKIRLILILIKSPYLCKKNKLELIIGILIKKCW